MTQQRFYVYEHWRPDLGICFWVGKGTDDRAYRFKRNSTYNAVISELASIGMHAEVRMVASGLEEFDALRIEQERINFWRSSGMLTNRYGSGNRSVFTTETTRQKIRAARLGTKASAESRARMSETHKRIGSVKRLPARHDHTPESKAKISARHRGKAVSETTREKLRLSRVGTKHSAETRLLISLNGKGLKRSEETKKRISAALVGRPVSLETRLKISTTKKARAVLEMPQ